MRGFRAKRLILCHLFASTPTSLPESRARPGSTRLTDGVRVIYYYHDDLMPLYLLTLFAKGDKANLTKAERNDLAGLVDVLVNIWKGRTKS